MKKSTRAIIARTAATATPTPMPALAPVESPDELDESVRVSEDVAVAAAVVVVAVFDTGVEAGGVLESLACHRIYTPYALMWSELPSAV